MTWTLARFLRLPRGHKPSVIQVRADQLSPGVMGDAVIAAIQNAEDELTRGALVTLDPHRKRLRILPLLKRE